MRVLLVVLLIGIVGCGGEDSTGEGAVPTTEGSQEKVNEPSTQAAAEQRAAAKKSVETQKAAILRAANFRVFASVGFSPDGKSIVGGGGWTKIGLSVWDVQTDEERLTLKGHSGTVRSAGFSPDGKRIFTGNYDGTIKIWDISSLDAPFN